LRDESSSSKFKAQCLLEPTIPDRKPLLGRVHLAFKAGALLGALPCQRFLKVMHCCPESSQGGETTNEIAEGTGE